LPERDLATICRLSGLIAHDATQLDVRGLDAPDARLLFRDGPVAFSGSLGEDAVASAGDLAVVADLELTNLDELQTMVGQEARGGALIAALYRREGAGFLPRLHGGFALALWDRRRQELVLAVDQFGIKRLYYLTDGARTAFASRPGALRIGQAPPPVSISAIFNYLNFAFVPAPISIFRGVARLAPGHLLRVRARAATPEAYWDLDYPERRQGRAEAAAAIARTTEAGIGRALRGHSVKEIGAFLSGGTDSSTVVGLMARLTGEQVNAFSIGFSEERYDELDYARLAAAHFGARHHTKIVGPDEALALMPRLVGAYDEPFGNNSAIGTYFCAQLARECGVEVLLAGDGGDEIFGGNERYCTDRVYALYHRIPRVVRRGVLEPLLKMAPAQIGVVGRAQRYVRRANIPNPRRFFSWEFFFSQEAHALFVRELLQSVDLQAPDAVTQRHYDRARATSELNRLLYLDMKLAIGDNDLLKVTQASELAGVQVRFPMLDPALVDLTGSLPSDYKVRGFEKRHIFKRAFGDLLPAAILAKRKHGFGVPTSTWIKSHPGFRALVRDTLLSSKARGRGYFRAGVVENLLDRHDAEASAYYGDLLWRILMLELWQLRHQDRAVVA
jgi:asparagine synthase (glutamine-hydrolysing)